jgi:hypothetical protein
MAVASSQLRRERLGHVDENAQCFHKLGEPSERIRGIAAQRTRLTPVLLLEDFDFLSGSRLIHRNVPR